MAETRLPPKAARAVALPVPQEVPRKNVAFQMFPLSADEHGTIDTILDADASSDIVVGPNHHFDADGTFNGFRVSYPPHTSGKGLPINRRMFFGHTIAEVSSSPDVNSDFLKLVRDPKRCREQVRELMQRIDTESIGNEPSLECMPHNVQELVPEGRRARVSNSLSVDSKAWKPELPDFLGVYHAFVRGYNKDVREHRVFLVCSGGCSLASDAFYNLLLDLDGQSDLDEIIESEEVWWLRNAAYRARCRLLGMLAETLGLQISLLTDQHAYDPDVKMARSTTDTVYNDINTLKSGHASVFNNVVDTTTSRNGIICPMHPSEGVWVFRGPMRSSAGSSSLGSGWGDQRECGIFPGGAFQILPPRGKAKDTTKRRTKPPPGLSTVHALPSDAIVIHGCADAAEEARKRRTPQQWSWFDEACMETLVSVSAWDRNMGVLELMPVTVGVREW